MVRFIGSVTLVFSLAAATVAERAEACSFAVTAFDSTYPGWGATGVPTNVVPFVAGSALDATLLLLRPEGGEAVEIELRPVGDYGWDLVPSAELLPNQRYELLAGDGTAINFETGSGPVAASEEPPETPSPEIVSVSENVGTCGTLGALCVAGERRAGDSFEIRTHDGGYSSLDGVRFWRPYSQVLASDECLVVRARDVRGNRSEPVALCDIEQRSSVDESFDCAAALADEPEPTPEVETPTPEDEMMPPVDGEAPLPELSMGPVGAGGAADAVDDTDGSAALVPVSGAKGSCTVGRTATSPRGAFASTGIVILALFAGFGRARRRR